MPEKSLTIFTGTPAEHFGGVLPQSFEPHYFHSIPSIPSEIAKGSRRIRWLTEDVTDDGKVRVRAAYDFEAQTGMEVPEDVWRRLACVAIVSHISGEALKEAYDCVVDCYNWTLIKPVTSPQIANQKKVPVKNIGKRKSSPFAYADD